MESYCNSRRRKLKSGEMRRHRGGRKRNRKAEKRGSKKVR